MARCWRPCASGALLYLEEFNRVPEETLNVLITVLTEGEIAVPRLGTVRADAGFRLIAAMNPFDAIGTARVSHAIADRICRVVLGYQDATAERDITTAVTGHDGPADGLRGDAHPGHPGAPRCADGLLGARRDRPGPPAGWAGPAARRAADDAGERPDAAYAALSGRIRIADGCDRTPESVLDELLDGLWPAGSPDPLPPPDSAIPMTPAPGPWTAREKVTACRRRRQAPAGMGPARTSAVRPDLGVRSPPGPGPGRVPAEHQPDRAGRPALLVRRGLARAGPARRGGVRPPAGRRPRRRRDPAARPGPGHRP